MSTINDYYMKVKRPPTAVNNMHVDDHAKYWLVNGNPWYTVDAGLRIDSTVTAYAYFHKVPQFTAEANYNALQMILELVQFFQDFEGAYMPDNYQVVNSVGLYLAATMFPEMSDSGKWKANAERLLNLQVNETVLDDGFYKELTFGYHRWMLDLFSKTAALDAVVNGDNPDFPCFAEKIEKMYELMFNMMDIHGYTPPISDSSPLFNGPLMSRAAALYGRGDFKYMYGDGTGKSHISVDDFWMLPIEKLNSLNDIAATPPDYTSMRLNDSRLYYMRNGWKIGSSLIFDGAPFLAGHYHHDQMNIIVASYGDALIVDPGKGPYGKYEGEQLYPMEFVYSKSHNTIMMDGRENPYRVTPEEKAWITADGYDYLHSRVDYSKATLNPVPFAMDRKIFFAKPDYWFISDLVTPAGSAVSSAHTWQQSFQLAPSAYQILPNKTVVVNDYVADFEDGTTGGFYYANPENGKGSVQITTEKSYSGTSSLKVTYNADKIPVREYIRNNIRLDSGARVNASFMSGISFAVYAEEEDYIYPFIQGKDGKIFYGGSIYKRIGVPANKDENGWEHFELPWSFFGMTAEDAQYIEEVRFFVGELYDTPKTIYIDDIKFYHERDFSKTGKDKANLMIIPANPDDIDVVLEESQYLDYGTEGQLEKGAVIRYVKKDRTGPVGFDFAIVTAPKGASPKASLETLAVTENGLPLAPSIASGMVLTITQNGQQYKDYFLTAHDGSSAIRQCGFIRTTLLSPT